MQRDIEPRFFGPRAVIGEIEALIEKRVDVGGRCSPEPSRECSSMFLTMESARLPCWTTFSRLDFQHLRQFADVTAHLLIERGRSQGLVQFVDQFAVWPKN